MKYVGSKNRQNVCKEFQREAHSAVFATNFYLGFLALSRLGGADCASTSIAYSKGKNKVR